MNNRTNKRKLAAIACLAAFILAVGGAILYYNQPERKALKEYRSIRKEYLSTTAQNADFLTTTKKMENMLENSSLLPLEIEAELKAMLADSLSEIDRKRATELLKDVASDQRYPDNLRVRALTYLADHYELDFTNPDFAKEVIFTGKDFENLLSDAGGDIDLAMRKLNEWSNAILPTLSSNYRIALWYATEIFKKNIDLSAEEKKDLLEKMNAYLTKGDEIFEQVKGTHPPHRLGIGYALKARAIYLSGGNIKEADKFFRLAMEQYDRQPVTIFQIVHRAQDNLYYMAFLARQSASENSQNIINLFRRHYLYLASPQTPEKRDIRLVGFITAARDSNSLNYPSPDFNKTDIENISRAYPELGELINKLDLLEYVKGHPAEASIRQ